MANFFPAIWNVLHDGVIVRIEGAVPGTIRVDVAIDYLRNRFNEAGDHIQVFLYYCTRFAYQPLPGSPIVTDLPAIVSKQPEILNASLVGDRCEIECACGLLEVTAASGSIRLDTGRKVELEELTVLADAYWTEWSEQSRKASEARLKSS